MEYTSASTPLYDNKVPHLRCQKGDVAPIVLLPGDPGRVEQFVTLCDDFRMISSNREYLVGTGSYKGVGITVCSTGIGAPSTEIAVLELISLGAKALIRIGGTAAIQEGIGCGELLVNTAAMRLGGSSQFYARPEYPAVASFEVVESLIAASEASGEKYHTGICASIGSFYLGQGRSVPGQEPIDEAAVLKEYRRLRITNLEMEAETIFTLASIYGVYSGSICTVHCNRITDQWLITNQEAQRTMCHTALEGAVKLYEKYLKENER